MKGDFSRDTFDPEKHFSRVLMQQGRVQLDSDWNEQGAILLHYLRTLAKDILGSHAGPVDEDERGFNITIRRLSHGMKSNEGETTSPEPKEVKGNSGGRPLDEDKDVFISQGRYYVEGILVENNHELRYSEQLGIGSVNQPPLDVIFDWNKDLFFYLDVWEREVTYVQDPSIREVALGGIDTCSRSQVVWQVKVLMCTEDSSSPAEAPGEDCVRNFNLPLPLGTGKLRARAGRQNTQKDELCIISPQSRYRGAENQLYRVEVHRGGKLSSRDCPTFKWSRDNGSVFYPILKIHNATENTTGRVMKLELEHLGRDQRLSLKPGDWVEYMDEGFAMRAEAGPMARVEEVHRADRSVKLSLPGHAKIPSCPEEEMKVIRPFLRRWDHPGDEKFDGALEIKEAKNVKNGWIDLEDGIQIMFDEGGEYRSGDYWLIPARVATGSLDWPHELNENSLSEEDDENRIPAAIEPRGPRHYYAPLSIVKSSENPQDCRRLISKNDKIR